MKIVFAGPTLAQQTGQDPLRDVEIRPPAGNGDIFDAVEEGATVIGIVDGIYENVAASWHKEILHALSNGVVVFGGGSIGALRAAECAAFGMIGVGEIYAAYERGDLVDDGDVAVLHGPEEMHFAPITEPLVNVRWTLENLARNNLLSETERTVLLETACAFFFKERTWKKILATGALPAGRRQAIHAMISEHYIDVKARDAEELLKAVARCDNKRGERPGNWRFQNTTLFNEWLSRR